MAKYNLLYLNNPDTLSKVTKAYFTKSQVSSLSKKYYSTATTLVNKCSIDTENINYETDIIKHLPSYLAGLIEGDGHFSSQQQLIIVFHSLDVSLAYYIKKMLGYGSVKKVKDKNAFILVISAKKGIEKVIHLINGKLITDNKYNQIIQNILNHRSYADFKKEIDFKLNLKKDLKNHWLAGFSESDTSFQIKILNQNNKVEVRLNFQIDQKNKDVLLLIKDFLGGNIGYRKSQDLYFYGSTSFGSAKNVINYFDKYHLLSSKHVNYLKWRKAYLIIQNKDYLTENDQDKLIKLKISIDRLSDATV